MRHCTRMGCCNKQRAVGARIAGLPQPSLRQRLSVFFGERLDFSAGIWIIAINTAFRRGFCGSVGGCPRNRHREMASVKPFPKTVIPPYPPTECKNHLRNPPCPQQHQEYTCKRSTHALPTCYYFRRQAIKHQGTRHRESCGSLIMLRLQFSSGTAHAPSPPQSPYSSLHRRGGSALN